MVASGAGAGAPAWAGMSSSVASSLSNFSMTPSALMGYGVGLQILSQWAGNWAQAQQEKQNAAFYQEQAQYAQLSAMRAERIAEFDYTNKVGTQIGAYASGGVDMSGSAATTVGGTLANALDEIWAIKRKGDLDVKLAMMRGQVASDRADTMGSVAYNAVQGATTALDSYSKSEGYGKGFPTYLAPDGKLPSSGDKESKYFPGEK